MIEKIITLLIICNFIHHAIKLMRIVIPSMWRLYVTVRLLRAPKHEAIILSIHYGIGIYEVSASFDKSLLYIETLEGGRDAMLNLLAEPFRRDIKDAFFQMLIVSTTLISFLVMVL